MQTDYLERRRAQQIDNEILIEPEQPVSISHLAHVLRNYKPTILLWMAVVTVAVLVAGIAAYLLVPAHISTSQPFRLDFDGAGQGEYPNKTKFNIADIINGPILTRVWTDNRLAEYVRYEEFSRGVYVLESNREYEELAAEYQSKLADPKLTPVDRDRLLREFDLKAQSIAKNEYTINIDRRVSKIPEPVARKVLLDILNDWADFAVNQQHVIAYQVSVLSPEVLMPGPMEKENLIAAAEVLRSRANRVTANIQKIEALPGATLARTPQDQLSLMELRIRIDEILRFRLEPLLTSLLHSSLIDRAATVQFLQSQLAYDQRRLESAQRSADAIRDSLAVYQQQPTSTDTAAASAKPDQSKGGEQIMPQLTDSFLDRLANMTARAADPKYRQTLVDDYRFAVGETIPMQANVAYDNQMLQELNKGGSSVAINATAARAELDEARSEIARIIVKTNELFQIVSQDMTPSTQLFSITRPPVTRTVRAMSIGRIALYGVLLLLVALPTIVLFCFLHNRVREEEASSEFLRQEHALSSAETLP